jgi:hypothetical protein
MNYVKTSIMCNEIRVSWREKDRFYRAFKDNSSSDIALSVNYRLHFLLINGRRVILKRIDYSDAREVGLASNGRAITGCSRSELDLNDIGDCRTDSGTGER